MHKTLLLVFCCCFAKIPPVVVGLQLISFVSNENPEVPPLQAILQNDQNQQSSPPSQRLSCELQLHRGHHDFYNASNGSFYESNKNMLLKT